MFSLLLNSSAFARKAFSAEEYSGILWTKIDGGIEYFYAAKSKVHITKISLENQRLRLLSYPSPNDSAKVSDSGFLGGITISEFARRTDASLAVNASPFWLKNDSETAKNLKILGVFISDGKQFSKPIEKYPALIFRRTFSGFEAKIVQNQIPDLFSGSDFAFGGFFQILKNGFKMYFPAETFDARTAVGLSANGKELFILSCKKNPGLSYQNCQEIFLRLGCADALQFDGGSSTSFFLKSKAKNAKFQSSLRATPSFFGFGLL